MTLRALKSRAFGALLCTAVGFGAAGGAAAQAASGQTLFQQRCAMCHAVSSDSGMYKSGPVLKGVVGRKAASAPDFEYSPALTKAKLTWDPASLDKYLTNPAKAVPGTSMPISVPKPEARTAIIDYLKTLK